MSQQQNPYGQQQQYGQQQGQQSGQQQGQQQGQQDQQGQQGGQQGQQGGQQQSQAGPGGKPLQQFPALLVNNRYHFAPILVHSQEEVDAIGKVDWNDWEAVPPQGQQQQQEEQFPQLIYNVNLPPMIVGSKEDMAALKHGPNSEWHAMAIPQSVAQASAQSAQSGGGGDTGPGFQAFFAPPMYHPSQPPQGQTGMGQTQEMAQRFLPAQEAAQKIAQALQQIPSGGGQQSGQQGQQQGGQQGQQGGQQGYGSY